jgi:hypothetical protein
MRARAAARALAAEPPPSAARLLAEAVALAASGEPMLAAALGEALLTPGPELRYEHLAEVYAAAAAGGLDEVRSLLVAPGPRQPFRERRDRAEPGLGHLTLGHKKALARGHRDADLLARLAAEGDPAVVRELLRNPRLTEAQVIRVVARRPCRPEVLRCVHDDARWRSRPAVRKAIALNPFAEPELVTKVLPTLDRRGLAAIAEDASLHALVRALAARLVAGAAGATAPPPQERPSMPSSRM